MIPLKLFFCSHIVSLIRASLLSPLTAQKNFTNLMATENIALVLLDIGLPDQNGIEVLKDIVPAHPDLGIIMVTGTTDIDIALDCLRHGADDYLPKPICGQPTGLYRFKYP